MRPYLALQDLQPHWLFRFAAVPYAQVLPLCRSPVGICLVISHEDTLCLADLTVPEFSWQCGTVVQIDRGMTQNQLSGL